MRSPIQLLARFNRQLLVDGVDLSAQQALQGWSAVVATDGSPVAEEASAVALHYLVGGGVGAVCGAGAEAAVAIDSAASLLVHGALAVPPVAHLYVASRGYGASVDIVATTDPSGWQAGRSNNARVCTAAFDFGRDAELLEAPFIGAATADLLLNHLLGLDDLPSIARFTLHDDSDPEFSSEPGQDMVTAHVERPRGRIGAEPTGFSLESLARVPGEFAKILDDCRGSYPNEACGYILRKDGALHTVVGENQQDRYHALDPTTYRRTGRTAFKLNEMKIARAIEAGGELVCIYHSHCDAGAYFSNEDVDCALLDGEPLFPGVAYLVVSVYGGDLRATELYGFDRKVGTYAPLAHP
jgi:[CysO sulfur-carrier protein]-S-L-cysteine hydrolase